MEIKEYVDEFAVIANEVFKRFPMTETRDVAIAILQERGKDRRQAVISKGRNNTPATERQLQYLKRLGVEAPKGLTKTDASTLIDRQPERT